MPGRVKVTSPSEVARFSFGNTSSCSVRNVVGGMLGTRGLSPLTLPVSRSLSPVALTQPVVRTTLFRDGRLATASVRPSETRVLWGGGEPPMCDGYVDGFAHGEADPRIWRYFGADASPDPEAVKRHPPGTLVSFATKSALALASAAPPVVLIQELDRERTGFVAGTWLNFDLDGDGIVDLAVWEGTGKAPGHLDGPTETDDPYYRLFLANLGGRWHVLGTDAFGYGCGC